MLRKDLALLAGAGITVSVLAAAGVYNLASVSQAATSTPSSGSTITGSSGAAAQTSPNGAANGQDKNTPNGHALTVTFTVDHELSPGRPAMITATVGNPNNQAVLISDVTGVVTAVDNANCSGNWVTITPFHSSAGQPVGINGSGTFMLPLKLESVATDDCKGAHFQMRLTATGRQA